MSHPFKSSIAKWGLLVSVFALTLLIVMLFVQPGAAQGIIHKVYITNVNDQKFTVSWTTDDPVVGSIYYGTSTPPSTLVNDSLNPTPTRMHYVDVTGLTAGATYFFQTVSGSTVDNNGGAYYSVTTGPALSSSPGATIYGYLFSSPGVTVTNPSIIYFNGTTLGGVIKSQLASVRTDTNGYYAYNIANLRTDTFQAMMPWLGSNTFTVTAQGGNLGTATDTRPTPTDATQINLTLNGAPNAITLRSLSSSADSSVWVPVGLALLGTATIVVFVARKRRA